MAFGIASVIHVGYPEAAHRAQRFQDDVPAGLGPASLAPGEASTIDAEKLGDMFLYLEYKVEIV